MSVPSRQEHTGRLTSELSYTPAVARVDLPLAL